jgi:hypothetical protein
MNPRKPAIDFQPITDALTALRASVEATLPQPPAITYKARHWVYDRADDEDGDRHDSVASYARAYNFAPDNLGGGTMAYVHYRDDESYVTITSRGDTLPDNFLSWCIVHVRRRDESGIDSYVCREDLPFCEAMHWAMHRETPAMHVQDYETVRGMPKVGEAYWIKDSIDRYPHFDCPANQWATITDVSGDCIHIRPATPVAWDEAGDDATWGCVQFYLPNDGLEEFYATCESLADHRKRVAEEAAKPLDEHDLAEEALNVAARFIQDRMGVTTGDAAGQFFAGLEEDHATDTDRTYEDRVTFIFREYIAMERGLKDAESK